MLSSRNERQWEVPGIITAQPRKQPSIVRLELCNSTSQSPHPPGGIYSRAFVMFCIAIYKYHLHPGAKFISLSLFIIYFVIMITYIVFLLLLFQSIDIGNSSRLDESPNAKYKILAGKSPSPPSSASTTTLDPDGRILLPTNVTHLYSGHTYCYYYTVCSNTSTAATCGHYIEQCKSEHICYALWNKKETMMLGCINDSTNKKSQVKQCHDDNSENGKDVFVCMCHFSFCNINMTRSDPIPLQSTPSPAALVVQNTKNLKAHIVKMLLISLIPICICIALAVYLVYMWPRKRTLSSPSSDQDQVKRIDDYVEPPHLSISLNEMLSSGRYGKVWKASCNVDRTVAVKVFTDRTSWRKERDVYLIPQMDHSNYILKFISAENKECIAKNEYWIITEYHSHGSLAAYLKNHTLTWREMLTLAMTSSRGLAYLHSQNNEKPCIVHRDFKSHNVLVKTDGTACVCDFGLAEVFRTCEDAKNCKMQVGTRRYMSPEVLEGAIDFEFVDFCRIDVYALSLVLWEMLTRCTGPNGEVCQHKFPYTDEAGEQPLLAKMHEVVVFNRERPKIPAHFENLKSAKKFICIIDECWDHDCDARLSTSCVAAKLQRLIEEQQPQQRPQQPQQLPRQVIACETSSKPAGDSSSQLGVVRITCCENTAVNQTEQLPLLKDFGSELNV